MCESEDGIVRKVGAMLTGLVDDPEESDFLQEMLDNERVIFAIDPFSTNSVIEDVMFAATRWAARTGQAQTAGQGFLAGIVRDALSGTEWNTAH